MSQVTHDIVKGIAQAAANAYDGALDDKGEPIKIGLKREEGHPVLDSRVMDGFKVRVDGNYVLVSYHTQTRLKDVYSNGFQNDMIAACSDVAKWLKKEYKKITGNALSLKKEGECDTLVERSSKVNCWAVAKQRFKIGGLKDVEDRLKASEDRIEGKFKEFLSQGNLGKRPKNKNQKG
jgi:hypothetical protein